MILVLVGGKGRGEGEDWWNNKNRGYHYDRNSTVQVPKPLFYPTLLRFAFGPKKEAVELREM